MSDKVLEHEHDVLTRRFASVEEAMRSMEVALREAAEENAELRQQLENADQNVLQQKQIVRDHIRQSAENEAALVADIIELRDKLKAV